MSRHCATPRTLYKSEFIDKVKKIYALAILISCGALIYSEYLDMARLEDRARLQAARWQLDADIRELARQSLLATSARPTRRSISQSRSSTWLATLTERIHASLAQLESGDNWRIHPPFISGFLKVDEPRNSPVPKSIRVGVARIEQALAAANRELDNLFTQNKTMEPSSFRGFVNNVVAVSDAVAALNRALQDQLNPGFALSERASSFIAFGVMLLSLGGLLRIALSDSRNTKLAVTRLLDETKGLTQGDLTVKVQVTGDVTAPVADSLNSAVGEMRVLVGTIRQVAGEVSQTAGKTEERITRLKTQRVLQSGKISDCMDDMMNLSDRVRRIGQAAAASTPPVRECVQFAQRTENALRDTGRAMGAAHEQTRETRNHLQRLVEGLLQARDITASIHDIAEQTHTLSLNACIQAEAETTEGLADMAEEIRTLAERSSHASHEMAELAGDLLQHADHAMTCIQVANRDMVSGKTGIDRTRHTLNQIETFNQPLPGIINELSDGLENELKFVEQVGKRMERLQDSTARAWLGVSRIAIALEKIKLAANRLEQASRGFRISESRSENR